jgi:transposase
VVGRERVSQIQRLQKTLEDTNIKLDSAISDTVGVSGRAMINALIDGETDPG